MKSYELQLNPQVISSYILKKLLKIKLEEYLAKKNQLKVKLFNEKKAFAIDMEQRPCFYKMRPRDIMLQIRHNKFKLLPISNTTEHPENHLQIKKAYIYSGIILRRLQDTACQYRTSINNKFLSVEFIKNRAQNIQVTNYRLRLQLKPYSYNKDLPH